MAEGFMLFETAIGRCGLAWGAGGLAGVQLPQSAPGAAWARMRQRFPQARETAPPPEVDRAADRIIGLLAGERDDLADIALDLAVTQPFNRRVYEIARAIRPGETSTYGQVARAMGEPGATRAVGRALGDNPWPIVVPCHRVLGADGKMGGFSADGGAAAKARLLTIEKARIDDTPTLFDLDFSVAPPKGR